MTRMRTIIATALALLSIALVVPSTAHADSTAPHTRRIPV